MDRQCSSCGGICQKSGCERENVKPEPKHPLGAGGIVKEMIAMCKEEYDMDLPDGVATSLYYSAIDGFNAMRNSVATNDTSKERVDKAEKDQHEPVAWINFCAFTGEMTVDFDCESELASIPLYKKEQL